jgi:protein SCO1/2
VGVVHEVQPEYGQVVIEHEDIPGLMPAMTMNFVVPDAELLAAMRPGQRIEFSVEFTGRSYRVIDFSVRGEAEAVGSGPRIAGALGALSPAPGFQLVDQNGAPFALADLRGKRVVLDFVYTQCPGPCPILTASHVALQRMLSAALRADTWFVSISLDPERDTPEALRAYAEQRGADLSHWSFLSGPADRVDAVIAAYGVGSRRKPDGEIEHLVVTYLIDAEGRIVRHYMGMEHEPEALLRDLSALDAR